MIVFVSGATATMRDLGPREELGVLFTPDAGNSVAALQPGQRFALDNAAFVGFDANRYVEMLERFRWVNGVVFVTAPDVVGDAATTLWRFRLWEPMLHALSYPVAFVGQDRLTPRDTPWWGFEAFFVGGSTAWKLSREARELVEEAKRRGKWVHMGRVNSRRRLRYAAQIGCDSVDGTGWSRWPNIRIPLALAWMQEIERCPTLF